MKLFDDFVILVKKLRSKNGCPWDRKQTFQSLTPYIIEEAYELVDCIKNQSYEHLKEELGDVLLHIVMLSNMAEEEKVFALTDVIQTISDKMIRRHPHVFGNIKAKTIDDVWKNWESIKSKEKKGSLFNTIPKTLPALMKSFKVQQKAALMGFDWESIEGPMKKIKEEMSELKDAINKKSNDDIENEIGDLLFSVVNTSRKLKIDPEEALHKSSKKFMIRFKKMIEHSKNQNKTFSDLTIEEMEKLWIRTKTI